MDTNLILFMAAAWALGLFFIIKNPFNQFWFFLAQAFSIQLSTLSIAFFITLLFLQQTAAAFIASIPIFVFLLKIISNPVKISNPKSNIRNKNQISLLEANINYKNNKIKKLSSLLIKTNPDIISVIEYHYPNDQLYKSLLSQNYKYQIVEPPHHDYAIGIFSKYPLKKENLILIDNEIILTATITINNATLKIVCGHPYPPITKRYKTDWDKFFKELQKELADKSYPIILIGDFNAVPWYPEMIKLVEQNNLEYASTIWQQTFPTYLPLLRIPIDHILITSNFELINSRRVKLPGSDHLGILANLQYVDKK